MIDLFAAILVNWKKSAHSGNSLLCRQYFSAESFSPSRLVFAKARVKGGPLKGSTSSRADEYGEEEDDLLHEEGIRDRIISLEEDKSLNSEQAMAAMKTLKNGSRQTKIELLRYINQLFENKINLNDDNTRAELAANLEKLAKQAEQDLAAKKTKPAGTEKTEVAAAEKAAAEETGETAEKPAGPIEDIQFGTGAKIKNLIAQNKKISQHVNSQKIANPVLGEGNMNKMFQDLDQTFSQLLEEDKKVGQNLKPVLAQLVKSRAITNEEANAIFDLNPTDPKFETEYIELTQNLDDKAKEQLKKAIKSDHQEIAAFNEKIFQNMHKFRDVMKTVSDQVKEKGDRETTIKNLSRATGLPIEIGKVFTYMQLEDDPNGKDFKKSKRYVTIKDITFDEIESYDEKGNIVFKIPTDNPVLHLTEVDQHGVKIQESTMNLGTFTGWVERQGVTEDIRSKSDLEKAIGENIKEGDLFEYLSIPDSADPKTTENNQVKILKIENGFDGFGEKTKLITLDKEIVVKPTTGEKAATLTMGEFAKWYNREEVMKSIDSISVLRKALKGHNEYLNKLYDRKDSEYPPIQAKPGEILKYDDNQGKSFVIQEANDNEILMDDGSGPMTLAAFLRWVKKNEVEKEDPKAHAEQASRGMADGKEKEEAMAQAEHDKAVEMSDRHEDSHDKEHHGKHGHHEDPSLQSVSSLRKLWMDTNLMTLHNMLEMGKKIYELIKRKLKRREEGTIGVVGEQMFSGIWSELGAEFKGVAQHAENEEVDHHVKHYKTMGIEAVKHELHAAPTKDILKAAIQVLGEKGQLRWDDPGLWDAINKYGQGSLYDDDGKELWVTEENHLYAIEKYLDKWWGQDTFREFRNKQDSSYNSVKKNFEDHAKRLESDPDRNGGLMGALQNLLFKHMRGEYVNPAQYEEYLHYAIQAGKMHLEDKLYFLIMGIGTEAGQPPGSHGHGHGQTLLHIDRIGALESDLLNNFPLLDFFTQSPMLQYDKHDNPLYEIDPKTGQPMRDPNTGEKIQSKGKARLFHFKKWIEDYCQKDLGVHDLKDIKRPTDLGAGENFKRFVAQQIAWDEKARERLEKASSNTSRWDHDDYHYLGPMLGEESIMQVLRLQGGATQNTSNLGIKNAYVGFNNFTKIKMEMLKKHLNDKDSFNTQKDIYDILNLMKSFIRFDSVLDNRFKHGENLTRFSDQEYNTMSVVDNSRKVRVHVEEMREFIGGLANALNLGSEWNNDVMGKFGYKPPTEVANRQANAVARIGSKIEGKITSLFEQDPAKVLELFERVNNENKGKKVGGWDLSLKGIMAPPKSKSDSEKVSKEMFQLTPYRDEEIAAKITEIKELEKERAQLGDKSREDIERDEADRLKVLRAKVEKNDFTDIDPRKDIPVLDNEISRLKGEVSAKKKGTAPTEKKETKVQGGELSNLAERRKNKQAPGEGDGFAKAA